MNPAIMSDDTLIQLLRGGGEVGPFKPDWSCYCGHLCRIKFRDITCPICWSNCQLNSKNQPLQMHDHILCNYQNVSMGAQKMLKNHHYWLVDQVRYAHENQMRTICKVSDDHRAIGVRVYEQSKGNNEKSNG